MGHSGQASTNEFLTITKCIPRKSHSNMNRDLSRETIHGLSKNWIFRFHPKCPMVLVPAFVCVSEFFSLSIAEASNAHTQRFIVYTRAACIHYSVSFWIRMDSAAAAVREGGGNKLFMMKGMKKKKSFCAPRLCVLCMPYLRPKYFTKCHRTLHSMCMSSTVVLDENAGISISVHRTLGEFVV